MVSTVFRKGEHRWRHSRGEKTHVIISKVLSFFKVHVCVFTRECVLMCVCRYMVMLMHVETGGHTQVLFLQRQPPPWFFHISQWDLDLLIMPG